MSDEMLTAEKSHLFSAHQLVFSAEDDLVAHIYRS